MTGRHDRAWWRVALLTGVSIVIAVGCGTGDETPTLGPQAQATATTTVTPTVHPAPGPTNPTATREPTPVDSPTTAPSGPVAWRVETIATGLEVPWEIAFAPDGRIFLTERPGRVRVIQDGQLLPDPAITIQEVAARGESGLLGLALDPNFDQNHWVYVYYTYATQSGDLGNRVVRYTESRNRLTEPHTILDGIPGATTHDGGRLAFGPDGKLYITTGDAQQAEAAQDQQSLAGKILRVNPDSSIPNDNPFPDSPVYSYGHRNPQGLAWEPGTDDLYATEHGPSAHDEVNRITPGTNYGWPQVQGAAANPPGLTAPVVASGDNTTWAPAGAAFVRADTFPQWKDDLLFTSLRSTALLRLELPQDNAGSPTVSPIINDEYGRLRQVVEGPDGYLYLLTSNQDGRGLPNEGDDCILRIVPDRR